ncbi:PLP-dependent transferase [Guyanagaster necrorhizus]|uniref:PLP-dependent transferase n=1 Tax=Guyanagaster necrorhizus TaxID=856835 RepID=A0A9P7VPI7_9AGAR|nr:PLP-dependent transferase [Guyanagaster necrorhizus MCA 3950]KAG7444323.1 PLP-dependent transferase [Guyanagaster necrorhizus MCA 3950]
MTTTSALDRQLLAALKSRDERLIRRRLPDPTSSTTSTLIDFNTNDYLSLASSPVLRRRFLEKLQDAPDVLGSGGSRLLVNGSAHSALEARLAEFFDSPAALLFNSGFDANVGFFSCIPQPGDVLVYDEYIHASVHDGIRASRAHDSQYSFPHNSLQAFRNLLVGLRYERPSLAAGESSVFVAVESLYSMDGTFAPLQEFVEMLEEVFPRGNGYLVVDEAHSTGIYGPQGRGRVAMMGLENRVFARLHTFGKALAATGAVLLTTPLIRDYMLNYARSLIYTTSLSFLNIIAADASFDMLVDGTARILSENLMDTSWYFTQSLSQRLVAVPPDLLSLPPSLEASPIIPIMTSQPRPLSAFLYARGMNARPITWPTVPKGKDRVRVCLHAGNSREDIDRLVNGMIDWAESIYKQNGQQAGLE